MTEPQPGPMVIELAEAAVLTEPAAGPTVLATDDPRPVEIGLPPVTDVVILERRRRRGPVTIALAGVGILVLGVLIFDAVAWVGDQFAHGPVIGGLALAVIAAGCLGIGYWLIAELRALAALRSVARLQLLTARSDGSADRQDNLVAAIEASLPADPPTTAALKLYHDQVQPHHSRAQHLALLSRTVLIPIDQHAEAVIRATVAQAVLFTAVSPTALMESLFFLARGLRLVRQIAELYGTRPGLAGTLYLMRRLIVGSGAVGTVDVIGNVLAQKLGGAILEKLSSDVAESVYTAQKMARLGILAMRLCRPIPFAEDDHPSLSRLVSDVLRR